MDVPQESESPSGNTSLGDSVNSQTGLGWSAVVAGDEVSLVAVVGSKSESREESESPVVLLQGPVFLNVDSTFDQIEVQVQGAWIGLAVEVSDGTKSGLSLVAQVSVAGWHVQDNIWVEAVALDGLTKVSQKFKDMYFLPWFRSRSVQ